MGTPSIYSHVTSRSSANLRASRSIKSLKVPWYRQPILKDAYFLDIQRGSMLMAGFSVFCSFFTLATAIFDIYSLYLATPGSTHYGYYLLSYEFVYVGSAWVRKLLILFALFSFLFGCVAFVTSIVLIIALRKEYEKKMIPWLYVYAAFTVFRLVAWLFFSIVNDLIFTYNIMISLIWFLFTVINCYGWLLVYSLFLELSDLTKLEDLAHLRMGTMQSLTASTAHSLAGSRPTTPHSTVSTQPVQ